MSNQGQIIANIRFYINVIDGHDYVEAEDDLSNHNLGLFLVFEMQSIKSCQYELGSVSTVETTNEIHDGIGNLYRVTIDPYSVTLRNAFSIRAPERVTTKLPTTEFKLLLERWMQFLESDGSEVQYQIHLLGDS